MIRRRIRQKGRFALKRLLHLRQRKEFIEEVKREPARRLEELERLRISKLY